MIKENLKLSQIKCIANKNMCFFFETKGSAGLVFFIQYLQMGLNELGKPSARRAECEPILN